MSNSYSLIDSQWIPCQYLDGSISSLGLHEILSTSHKIKTITSSFSMEKVALIRLFLAILHRTFGPPTPKEWLELWQKKHFNENGLEKYFQDWQDRFNLFDKTHPFFQTKNITTETRSFNGYSFHLAVFHIASGNNATLFDHHTSNDELVFSPAEAARLIVTAQSFSFGFRSFKDGPSARGINFIITGENLFETLMLNFIQYNDEHPFKVLGDDLPAWERDDAFTPERTKPDGYLDYLTWQSRKILFNPNDGVNSIKSVQVDNGLKLDVAGEPYTKNPMMQYTKIEKPTNEGAPYRPLKFNEGRAIWRDSTSIIQKNSENNEPPAAIQWVSGFDLNLKNICLNSIGISSDQGKVNFYLEENFSFPVVYLHEDTLLAKLKTCLEITEETRNKLWGAINRMVEIILSGTADSQEGIKPDPNDKQQLIEHIFAENLFWVDLEVSFYQLLHYLPKKEEDAISQWHQKVQQSAWKAFTYARDFVGNSPRALKAAALAGRFLDSGLKKIFVN